MVTFGLRAHAAAHRRELPGLLPDSPYFVRSEWLESGRDPQCSPNVFLVEQPPHAELPVHFHTQNQFQVFVQGQGVLGKSAVRPVMVHYAGAYTAYGPLVSAESWIRYFTLRPIYDPGAKVLPERRDAMRNGPKRHVQSEPYLPLTPEQLSKLPAMQSVVLMPEQADGLFSAVVRLPPGSVWPLPAAAAGGQFLLVLSGSVRVVDTVLETWETMFTYQAGDAITCVAGNAGVELLLLQTPAKDPQYADA